MSTLDIIAQATQQVVSATQPAEQAQPSIQDFLRSPMFLMMLGLLVFWFWIMRSKKGQERKRTDMLAQLKKGDRVQTIGGIYGSVVEVRETEVVLKVDETSNTKIKFSRSAIHRVVVDEESQSK